MTTVIETPEGATKYMSSLTSNRILQKGDEFLDGLQWKPVPKDEFGLQIIFSKLKDKELRRPSEKEFPIAAPAGKPLYPSEPPAKSLPVIEKEMAERAGLPTVVSKKAHLTAVELITSFPPKPKLRLPKRLTEDTEEFVDPTDSRGTPDQPVVKTRIISPDSEKPEAAKPSAKVTAKAESDEIPRSGVAPATGESPPTPPFAKTAILKIPFPKIDPTNILDEPPIWTGRNGTFTGYGLDLFRLPDAKMVAISPIGKRGVGNCTIQFPTSVIPQIIDWLAEQYRTTPK